MTNDLRTCLEIICNFPTIYKMGGKSPVDIIRQSGYADICDQLTEDQIAKHINENPELVETWIDFTYDIRHSPAWGLQAINKSKWIVFYSDTGKENKVFTFDKSTEACAMMIKMTIEGIKKRSL